MKGKVLLIGALTLALTLPVVAQRRGGSGGMQGGNQGQGGGFGQGRGQMSGTMSGDQQRLRIHATDQQRQQLKTCTQSADRIRTRTREMLRASNMTPDQAKQWRERLRTETQALNQNQQQLMAGLTDEQKDASGQNVREMEQSRTQLLEFLELLDGSLAAPELQQDRVRDQARDAERAATQLKKSQTELLATLNKS